MEKKKLNRKCGTCKVIKTVGEDIFWQADPYGQAIHGDDDKMWLCDDCYWDSSQAI